MIKIIQGIYGYKNTNGAITPKTSIDEPFNLTDEQEARLVKRKIAVYIEESNDEEHSKVKAAEGDGEQKKIELEGTIAIEVLEAMEYNDLKKLAKELGVSANGKREELVDRMAAVKVKSPAVNLEDVSKEGAEKEEVAPVQPSAEGDQEENEEEPPELKAADPE